MPKKSGIYWIRNILNGKYYIGSSDDCSRRWIQHRCNLKAGTHHNEHLQRAYEAYGKHAFKIEIIEYVPREQLQQIEQWYLENTRCLLPEFGYNVAVSAFNQSIATGTREKIRQSMKSVAADPSYREKLKHRGLAGSIAAREVNAKKKTPESNKKRSDSLKKFLRSKEGMEIRKKSGRKSGVTRTGKTYKRPSESVIATPFLFYQ